MEEPKGDEDKDINKDEEMDEDEEEGDEEKETNEDEEIDSNQDAMVVRGEEDQSFEKAIPIGKPNEQTIVPDNPDSVNVDNSNEVVQDPPVIDIVSEKVAEKTNDTKKDDGKDESAEGEGKEKGEEKEDQAPVTVAKDTIADKGKQIAIYSDDFG
ncbi:uncharacterized protein LOC131858881 [Cryptomeria japonica]|uniref:uncharacterized protein LOC131858881 n=1 Tax=Cryptomeria japonica TaxID=3369 RepID=UPI0027DA766B|nr:uncharacterized protein LOC131858881 [Cryptomeria japonica]